MTPVDDLISELRQIRNALGEDSGEPLRQPRRHGPGESSTPERVDGDPIFESGRWEIADRDLWEEEKQSARRAVEGEELSARSGVRELGLKPLLGTSRSMTTSAPGAFTFPNRALHSWTSFTSANCGSNGIAGSTSPGRRYSRMSKCISRLITPALGSNCCSGLRSAEHFRRASRASLHSRAQLYPK